MCVGLVKEWSLGLSRFGYLREGATVGVAFLDSAPVLEEEEDMVAGGEASYGEDMDGTGAVMKPGPR